MAFQVLEKTPVTDYEIQFGGFILFFDYEEIEEGLASLGSYEEAPWHDTETRFEITSDIEIFDEDGDSVATLDACDIDDLPEVLTEAGFSDLANHFEEVWEN